MGYLVFPLLPLPTSPTLLKEEWEKWEKPGITTLHRSGKSGKKWEANDYVACRAVHHE